MFVVAVVAAVAAAGFAEEDVEAVSYTAERDFCACFLLCFGIAPEFGRTDA